MKFCNHSSRAANCLFLHVQSSTTFSQCRRTPTPMHSCHSKKMRRQSTTITTMSPCLSLVLLLLLLLQTMMILPVESSTTRRYNRQLDADEKTSRFQRPTIRPVSRSPPERPESVWGRPRGKQEGDEDPGDVSVLPDEWGPPGGGLEEVEEKGKEEEEERTDQATAAPTLTPLASETVHPPTTQPTECHPHASITSEPTQSPTENEIVAHKITPSPTVSAEPPTSNPTETPTLRTIFDAALNPTMSPTHGLVAHEVTPSPVESVKPPTSSPTATPTLQTIMDATLNPTRLPAPTVSPTQYPTEYKVAAHKVTPSPVESAEPPTNSPTGEPTLQTMMDATLNPTRLSVQTFSPTEHGVVANQVTPSPVESSVEQPTFFNPNGSVPPRAPYFDGIPFDPSAFTAPPFLATRTLQPTAAVIADQLTPAPVPLSTGGQTPAPTPGEDEVVDPTDPPVQTRTNTPTRRPTPRPTLPPTRRPTFSPTRRPTPGPTEEPTELPTPPPTPEPTEEPTSLPTREPTPIPTPLPLSPTFVPTTATPTLVPTPEPTREPTSGPTANPSDTPTLRPSPEPSWLSAPPSRTPTTSPTSEPTPWTFEPTVSKEPTNPPVSEPSNPPSTLPTRRPIGQPSQEPTLEPTAGRSSRPTLSVQEATVEIITRFTSVRGRLSREAVFDYVTILEDHIEESINARDHNQGDVTNLNVQVIVAEQLPSAESIATSGVRARHRSLQEGEELAPLSILSDANIEFQSTFSGYSASNWVKEAFDDEEEINRFLRRLKQSHRDFGPVDRVEVSVDGDVLPVIGSPGGSDDNSTGRLIVLGAALFGFLALVVLGFLALKRLGRPNGTSPSPGERRKDPSKPTPPGKSSAPGPNGLQTEILVERQDDISTLGDPVFGGGMAIHNTTSERDERTASLGDDYDYAKQYLLSQGVPSMDEASRSRFTSSDSGGPTRESSGNSGFKQGPLGTSVFADDASFEQQYADAGGPELRFDVEVPAGKLGMVIDTPNGSVPVVHAIKPESVLANHVRVGDRLVSVDGEDVTELTAVQVSKLISLKSDETRVLAFVRARTRDDSIDNL